MTNEIVGSTTGEPNQAFALASTPVVLDTLVVHGRRGRRARSSGNAARTCSTTSADDGSIVTSDANATDYYVQFDEDGRASVVFGDGEYGRKPPVGRTPCAPRT